MWDGSGRLSPGVDALASPPPETLPALPPYPVLPGDPSCAEISID